jgi:hypothetical protein
MPNAATKVENTNNTKYTSPTEIISSSSSFRTLLIALIIVSDYTLDDWGSISGRG